MHLSKIVLLCFLMHVDFTFGTNQKSVRLLLNDPDVAGTRLLNLEKEMQDFRKLGTKLQADLLQSNTAISQANIAISQANTAISQLKSELLQEKTRNANLEKTLLSHGSTYVRWGRKQCSIAASELVYSGFAAGQEHNYDGKHNGGPANMLCLPRDPELSNRTTPQGSRLYGSEYDSDFFRSGAKNEDVPCALCRSINTTSSVMIPGRISCYLGWKVEYNGVLASMYYDQKASSYICVDNNPEYLQAGQADLNGHLLYSTTTVCGSLPCPPYADGLSINCVVCSK